MPKTNIFDYMRNRLLAIIGIIISSIYLLNFTAGIWELPDNLPIIGNLDELAAATLLIASLKHFGVDLTSFWKAKKKSSNNKNKG
jgi:uncharacterized membrane protein YkvA (DUF1232 family)